MRLAPAADPDEIYGLLGALRQNGQMLGREFPPCSSRAGIKNVRSHPGSRCAQQGCGRCFDPVPLYRAPPTYDKSEFYNVTAWVSDYHACDTLQMNCRTGERFGIREMSEAGSSLSQRGRGLCADIEKGTGKPTYYLFRYVRRTTREKERARRCPLCGSDWLLEKPWQIFDFRCEACRLVSTLSPTVA